MAAGPEIRDYAKSERWRGITARPRNRTGSFRPKEEVAGCHRRTWICTAASISAKCPLVEGAMTDESATGLATHTADEHDEGSRYGRGAAQRDRTAQHWRRVGSASAPGRGTIRAEDSTPAIMSSRMPRTPRRRTAVPTVKYCSGGTMPVKAPRNRSVSCWSAATARLGRVHPVPGLRHRDPPGDLLHQRESLNARYRRAVKARGHFPTVLWNLIGSVKRVRLV